MIRYFLLLLIVFVSCSYPKLNQPLRYCDRCNHNDGAVYFRNHWRNVQHTSTGKSDFIYRHKKVYIQPNRRSLD